MLHIAEWWRKGKSKFLPNFENSIIVSIQIIVESGGEYVNVSK